MIIGSIYRQDKERKSVSRKEKVIIGMSGGVDSSVAAWLLKEQGYEVIGVTMQIWQDEEEEVLEENGGCCGLSAVEDARRTAQLLEIPHYVMNFKADFKRFVIDYFVSEYLEGRTPNPCIACNRYVKWEALLNRSLEIGADYIATGHYARIRQLENGRFCLTRSVTAAKDQTYALYNLTQNQLSHTLMPVGSYSKEEIRRMADQIGLSVADKPDSQEICFVPDQDYAGFIERTTGAPSQTGNFVQADGTILGQHKGIIHYTIGQRRGLGLPMGRRVVVTEIRPETNEVVIGEQEDVWTDHLLADRLNWMSVPDLTEERSASAKIRYNHTGTPCTLQKNASDQIRVQFHEPVRAVTPGQAVVFYDGDCVLGGGTILK